MSKKLRRWELAAFLVTVAAGTLLHFTYGWSGENRLAAAFSAVNESTWEHMKLLFFPLFATSLVEMLFLADRWRNFLAVKLVATLAGVAAIPVLFYTYTGAWGQSSSWVNIAIFFLAALAAFLLSVRLLERGRLAGGALQIGGLLGLWALAFLFVFFTFRPPHIALFQDPLTGLYGI